MLSPSPIFNPAWDADRPEGVMAMAMDITIDDMIEAVHQHALEMQAKVALFGPDSWHAKQAAILHAAVAVLEGVRHTDEPTDVGPASDDELV
jgi:hypothetical protein